ncbi:Pyridoxine/pyridoxamine 5'-phosphate oxidase [Microbacterium sp. TNHR37B]|nr:Pyridoxine/pyridoxamine 5'-phosphate oxidase [Microbacterium sp. TNHR37B]
MAGEEALTRHTDYGGERLEEGDLAPTPHEQFARWLDEAARRGVYEPNAMVLGTIGADGVPQSRTVLCRGVDERGFVFYTDRSSRKGRALSAHPVATLLFPWYALHRQVIVTGVVDLVDDAESDAYWDSRPHGSRIAATASRQSQPVDGRDALEARVRAEAERYPAEIPVPRPERWGGYRVAPTRVEFWQGRTSRLHDRLVFSRPAVTDPWRVERLQP